MSLGETIYRLRTEKNLSQGDLAELLDVSRQSVSKWENDSAVPDLAKIVKLSEVFGVTLDELVKGESTTKARENAVLQEENISPNAEIKSGYNNAQADMQTGIPGRKIAGIILFCMAFLVVLLFTVLGGFISGIIYSSPFWICGILCFSLKRNVGLWCAWAVYALVDTCLATLLGFSRAIAVTALRSGGWTVGSIFAWVMIFALVVLIAVTVVRFGKKLFPDGKKGYVFLITPWVVWLVLHGCTYRRLSMVLSWGRIIAFTAGLVMLVRFIRTKKGAGHTCE